MACGAAAFALLACSCQKTDMSNKEERNAIRHGNKMFEKNKFGEAVSDYNRAIEANPESDAGFYNRSLATLFNKDADSTTLRQARVTLDSLAKNGTDVAISEKALYNLGNDAVYMGDMLKAASEDPANQNFADSLKQMSTQSYKQAIEQYKKLLRKRPNSMRAVQNLRIAQLKLPPEEQGGGGGGSDNQQQQQQQQQQQPEQQNQNDKQVLQSVQQKENQTRKEQPTEPATMRSTDKPW